MNAGEDFGPWLARQLKRAGMNQADLAERIGLTRAAVSAWITGRATPREETMRAIAAVFDTDYVTMHLRTADAVAASRPVGWYHRPAYGDGGRDFGNAAAFAFEADVEVLAREATQNSLDERLDGNRPVRVRYTLHELTGESLARFREAIKWDDLYPHYEAASSREQKVGRVIAEGLRDMYERDCLVLLRVDDYNASGLTGDDYEDGRFAAVVRRQLESRKSGPDAGGSYGLGKATLWATSRLGLVLINSTLNPSEPHEGRTERRLVGRLDLPWREVDGDQFAGPAWFGEPDAARDDKDVVRSWWADEETVERLHLTRESSDPGTSFLIVGAHDVEGMAEALPTADGESSAEEEEDIRRMHGRLVRALGRNFWAAMTAGGEQPPFLEASVRSLRNGEEVLPEERVDPHTYQPARARALRAFLEGTTVERLTEAGQVAMTTVPLVVPALDGSRGGDEHRAVLLVTDATDRLDKTDDDSQPYRVTSMRGNRMTVRTNRVPDLAIGTNPFQAVLLAGRAAGDVPFADRAEEFLRASEPPEHNKWGQTEELRLAYSPSAHRRIASLTTATNRAVRDLVVVPRTKANNGTDKLRKRLSVGRKGGKASGPAAVAVPKLDELQAEVGDDGAWHVSAEVKVPAGGDTWRLIPVAKVDVRSGPRPVLAWSQLVAVRNCELIDGSLHFTPGARSATFRGVTDVSTHPVRATHTGLVVELRTGKGDGA
ncbi:helix-turn-helix transcriptional regulator [Streptomyces sp. NPDC048441]|uniref:helix-turn-helix transcriptional regulator n=1 Tax=Streptomyces sp. NPDC048441 TaxID=3365552 RepID=UPI00370F79E1